MERTVFFAHSNPALRGVLLKARRAAVAVGMGVGLSACNAFFGLDPLTYEPLPPVTYPTDVSTDAPETGALDATFDVGPDTGERRDADTTDGDAFPDASADADSDG